VSKYSVLIKQSAQRELDSLSGAHFGRIDRKIPALADDPRPAGCRKLRGYADLWRIRIGDWRVIYVIDDSARLVTVTRVVHRRDAYE
jgi:mRNA interferase RelE/StbE